MIVTKAPSKVILFGEHAVVYDKLGIVAATAESTKVSLDGSRNGITSAYRNHSFHMSKDDVDVFYKKFKKLHADGNFDEIKKMTFDDALTVLYKRLGDKFGSAGIEMNIEQDRSLKGLGGSASTFAAMTLGYATYVGKEISRKSIAEISLIGDVVAHGGTPSGIDTNAVTYGGYLSFQKSRGMKAMNIDMKLPIIIVDSGEKSETSKMVSMVRDMRKEKKEYVDRVMHKLERITKDALGSLEKKDVTSFGSLMYDYYTELHKLDISTKRLDDIVDIARKNEALGAKPTGAWGGGNCIVMARDAEYMKDMIEFYNLKGYRAFSTELGVEGVRVIEQKRPSWI